MAKPAEPVQPAPGPSPSSTEEAPTPAQPAEDPSLPEMEFTGPDGEQLSPERQKEFRERLKNVLPSAPVRKAKGSTRAGSDEIVVTGQRPRGSVIGDIPPAQTLSPLDIRAYGASTIGELLQTLGSQVSSDRGRTDNGPIVLLNGKRVSSFAEISRIPTEAIERMEVFPEEVALKYGYRADQKVVNIVTYERFSSQVGQMNYAVPTDGGRDTIGLNANFLHISGDTRINLDADYSRSGSLLESERGVRQVAPAPAPGPGRLRTLLPEARRLALNAAVSGQWLSGVSSTLNGRFEASESEDLLGLTLGGALKRDIDTRAAHLGTAHGGLVGKWLWSLTGNYDRTSISALTAADDAPRAIDEARSVNALVDADLLVSGTLLNLPAGPVTTSLRAGGEIRDFNSRSLRGGGEQSVELSRDTIGAQVNLDLPIASRNKKRLTLLGDLSANVNLALETFSDFGTLRTLGYGVAWSPVAGLNIIASATNEEGAPAMEQLGAPLVATPNVRTFDFARREAVDVTQVFGGNSGLRSDDRHVFKLGLNAKPLAKTDLTISVDYIRARTEDPIVTFPIATPEIEAAFPERFERGADGRLLRIDSRPLNLERSDQKQLRWGVNFTRPLGKVPAHMRNSRSRVVAAGADLQSALPPGAIIIKSEPGSAAARAAENISSRLTLSLYHKLTLVDEILVREGGPVLDLLNGSAADNRGGRPRHELEFQAIVFRRGIGARMQVTWQSATTVRGLSAGPTDGSADLSFSNPVLLSINLFANLEDHFGGEQAPDWLKRARISVGIQNVFGTRPQVRDAAGSIPLSYQPAYLDPLGRVLTFSLRKVF
ncbi:MAG TPA: TonB-dependent receptor [Allosphingosinicella sp.]